MKSKISKIMAYFLVLVMLITTSMPVLAEGEQTVSENDLTVSEEILNEESSVSDNDQNLAEELESETEDEESELEETDTETELEETGEENVESEEELFPGLPEGYVLSAMEKQKKELLEDTLRELDDLNEGNDYVAGEVFFTCDTLEQAELYAQAYGANLKSFSDGVAVITLPKRARVVDAVRAASNVHSNLPAVSPNYYRYAMDLDTEVLDDGNYNVAVAAYTDPMLSASSANYQWQHQVVGSAYAWNNGYRGQGIKVAVLDTGVSPHEDLTIIDNYNAAAGATSGTVDEDGHGTHVAGIIGAKNNNQLGGSGIAPEAQIYNIKVLGNDEEAGTSATLVRGINKAIEWKVDIINMSLGGPGRTSEGDEAINNAVNQGIAVFVAAGNDCSMTKMYPAAYNGSICVAATDTNNSRAYFSNYGSWVDLAAPGVNIYSTVPGGYDSMSGTSQATPVAAGTAAVILSSGHASLAGKTGAARVQALKSIMQGNVIKCSGSNIGKGITNLPKVLKLSTIAGTPNQPAFSEKGGTYTTESLAVSISAEAGMTIYYTTDGKSPSFKNGIATGTKYEGPVTLSGIVNEKVTGKMTLKAIAVNAAGKVSKVASATYTFKPKVTGITISGLKEVVAGKSITLKATVEPAWAANKGVTWSIEPKNDKVSIGAANGKITTKAGASGEFKVTATAKDGSGISGEYNITVAENARISSIKFTASKDTMERDAEITTKDLKPLLELKDKDGLELSPIGNVDWSSSNNKVAIVDENGLLIAKAAGTVTVTATAADGSGKTAKLKLTIVQMAESLTITGSATAAKGKTVTLKAVIAPTSVKDKNVTWTITDANGNMPTGITVNKGKVRVDRNAAVGTYVVTATCKNGVTGSKEIRVVDNPITRISTSSKNVTLFRVSGDLGTAPTSQEIELDVQGGYDADSLTIKSNSAPGIVTAYLQGKTLIVTATGKTTGKATITVAATDGSNKSAKCTVNVINPASNITISPASGRNSVIAQGKTLKLSAVMETEYGVLDKASKKVKWTSANENVATVNASGVVTAKRIDGFGGTIIRAEATDGSGIYAEYEVLTCKEITSLTFSTTLGYSNRVILERSLAEGGMQIPIRCNGTYYWLSQAGAYPELNIEVKNPDIAAVFAEYDDANDVMYLIVFPYKAGQTMITLKPNDGSKASASVSAIITN